MKASGLFRGGGMPSALAVDLAIARLDLATLRAGQGLQLDEQTKAAAKLIRDFLLHKLSIVRNKENITEDLIPKADAREALQNSLPSIFKSGPVFDQTNLEIFENLVKILSTLVETGRCESQQAEKLRSALHSFERKPAPSSSSESSEFTGLSELLNA